MLMHQAGDVVVVRGRPFQLVSLMARGGQGSVFEARDDQRNPVAIKLVPANARHRLETKILASLKSDHIVQLLDAGVTRDTLIMVLERVEGVDLKAMVRLCIEEERSMPPALAVELVQQACFGLLEAYAHGQVAFHRDIKPGNILLSRDGIVKLIDFGIAHREGMDYTGSLLGTPEYMAPEQLGMESNWKVDVRTDLYCLSLVLFELLTLETFYEFPAGASPAAKLKQVWDTDPTARINAARGLGWSMCRFLRKALQRDPNARFQTPAAVLEALHALRLTLPPGPSIQSVAEAFHQASQMHMKTSTLDRCLPPGPRARRDHLEITLGKRLGSPHPARPSRHPLVRALPWLCAGLAPACALFLWLAR